eukprot:8828840-Alexandrium_andersonii.AAC.1
MVVHPEHTRRRTSTGIIWDLNRDSKRHWAFGGSVLGVAAPLDMAPCGLHLGCGIGQDALDE